jgi:hypothetical protein
VAGGSIKEEEEKKSELRRQVLSKTEYFASLHSF